MFRLADLHARLVAEELEEFCEAELKGLYEKLNRFFPNSETLQFVAKILDNEILEDEEETFLHLFRETLDREFV